MDLDETPDQYFGYDARLASFQISKPAGKRKSNTKGKAAKALAWPHQHLDADSFARAGFYFDPTPEYPDNTVCFLCSRKIGGWEDGDNPFEEHLRLSPHCGWAIVAAIETGLGDYYLDDPAQPHMVEARKATFGERWPHEGKRGWKCKTKQLVEAGWKYTPTAESDDMATCTYCQLALDGWEQKDNPMHEHYKRSPGCQFFLLLNQYQQGPTKKAGRGKGARTSKASSRLSVQSATTAASNSTLLLDHPAEHDDSVMTATSVMTQGSTKRGRTKKATTARGKKTRAKKDEVVEVLEDPPEIQEETPQPPEPARGRKRASDAVEDSVMTTAEAPAPKKRATRGRRSNTVDTTIVDQHDVDMSMTKPAPPSKAKGKKGRASNTRTTRKASVASNMSVASIADADDEHLMDDEALNRQLEADLDRPLSDDENIDADSDSGRKKAPVKPKKATTKKGAAKKQEDTQDHHSMFDPTPAEVNEDDVDAELKTLEAEMEVEPAEKLQVPKKGRKAGTRKVSKQTKKTQKSAPVEPEPEPEQEPESIPEPVDEAVDVDELAEGHEESMMSMMSNATVLNKRTSSTEPPKKKRGRPSKKASLAKAAAEAAESARLSSIAKSSPKIAHIDFAQSTQSQSQQGETPSMSPPPQVLGYPTLPSAQDEEEAEDEEEAQYEQEQERPATPEEPLGGSTSSAKQATISPSHSPQSSDAENQPPSSRPSNTTSRSSGARAALAPVAPAVATTPVRSSPSKSSRGYQHHQSQNSNTLSNLQSSYPWSGVDLDMVFDDVDRENKENPAALAASKYLHGEVNRDGIGDPLTSPEKRMTVEEWIHHNATQAEQKLRLECEATVSAFEREGTRAMMALEGLVIE